jgi:hypothetical protein
MSPIDTAVPDWAEGLVRTVRTPAEQHGGERDGAPTPLTCPILESRSAGAQQRSLTVNSSLRVCGVMWPRPQREGFRGGLCGNGTGEGNSGENRTPSRRYSTL